MFPKIALFLMLLCACGVLSACSSAPSTLPTASVTSSATRIGQLTPYLSPAPASTAAPTSQATLTPHPTASPTPRTHTIQKGEDMGGIAYRYRVSVAELMTANPGVNPHAMSIGAVLTIPQSKTPFPTEIAAVQQVTPTPLPLQIGQVHCMRGQEGGIWCFAPVQNSQAAALEGVSALIKLGEPNAQPMLTQMAFLPLDVLPADGSLPLAAYFSPSKASVLPPSFQASSEIQTALFSADDGRYLQTQFANQKVTISEDGLSAEITADVQLTSKDSRAQRIWVAAAAYDEHGNVIGLRRWENKNAQPLESGQALKVSMSVYTISGIIARVDLLAEARP